MLRISRSCSSRVSESSAAPISITGSSKRPAHKPVRTGGAWRRAVIIAVRSMILARLTRCQPEQERELADLLRSTQKISSDAPRTPPESETEPEHGKCIQTERHCNANNGPVHPAGGKHTHEQSPQAAHQPLPALALHQAVATRRFGWRDVR